MAQQMAVAARTIVPSRMLRLLPRTPVCPTHVLGQPKSGVCVYVCYHLRSKFFTRFTLRHTTVHWRTTAVARVAATTTTHGNARTIARLWLLVVIVVIIIIIVVVVVVVIVIVIVIVIVVIIVDDDDDAAAAAEQQQRRSSSRRGRRVHTDHGRITSLTEQPRNLQFSEKLSRRLVRLAWLDSRSPRDTHTHIHRERDARDATSRLADRAPRPQEQVEEERQQERTERNREDKRQETGDRQAESPGEQ